MEAGGLHEAPALAQPASLVEAGHLCKTASEASQVSLRPWATDSDHGGGWPSNVTEEAQQAKARDAGSTRRGRWSRNQTIDVEDAQDIYDEFAIGWNEIFEEDQAQTIPQPRSARAAGVAPAGAQQPGGSSSSKPARARSARASTGPDGWSTGIGTAAKRQVPAYLSSDIAKRSVVERRMKEKLMSVPISVMRKNAQIMDVELDYTRKVLTQEHQAKRKERRHVRRLHRRCQVKDHEDLDELEQRYATSSLTPLSAPWGSRTSVAEVQASTPAKDFFQELTRPRHAPLGGPQKPVYSPAVSAVVTKREAPHLLLAEVARCAGQASSARRS